jgi:hypothetical protein
MKDVQKEMTTYEEATEACLEKLEANPGELQFVVVHQEVPKEEAVGEMITVVKDRHPVVGHHQQPKKRIKGSDWSWQKLAATQGPLTRCAIPALHKRHGRQVPRRDNG